MTRQRIKWQPIVKATSSLLFQWYVFEGHKTKYFRKSLNFKVGLSNEKQISGEIFIDLNEWAKLEKVLTKQVKDNPKYFERFINLCYKNSAKLIKVSKYIGRKRDWRKYENREVLMLYKQYQNCILKLMPFLNATLVLDKVLQREVLNALELELGLKKRREQDLLLSKLIIPKKKSFFVQETEALLKIALKLQKNIKADIKRDIQEYLKKYTWMSCLAYVGKFNAEKDIKKKLKFLLKENLKERISHIETIKKETRRGYKDAFNTIKGSKRLINLIDITREFIYLQQYRLDVLFMVHHYVYSLFEEIGRRLNLEAEEVVYLTGEEIINALFGTSKVEREEIKDRRRDFALIKINNEFKILSGDKVKRIVRKVSKASRVEGFVANRGRSTGKAKLLFEKEDIDKVIRGDIVISPMTRPELVPAIIKSSGIITDFGGILCHAAIISREFGIPCLVGTKKATKVFKDGDLVELNAYDGVARKL